MVTFQSEQTPEINRACFSWAGTHYSGWDGPYCFRVHDVRSGAPGTFKVQLRTNNPSLYTLEAYVEYLRDGKTEKSNGVRAQFSVQ